MNCSFCKKPTSKGTIHPNGFACYKCGPRASHEWDKHCEALLNEGIGEMPDEFTVADFDRYALKVALHILRDLPDEHRMSIGHRNPLILIPSELSLDIKAKVIDHIPLYYISRIEAEGHARLFYGGTFQFKCKVPKGVIIEAFRAAGVLVS